VWAIDKTCHDAHPGNAPPVLLAVSYTVQNVAGSALRLASASSRSAPRPANRLPNCPGQNVSAGTYTSRRNLRLYTFPMLRHRVSLCAVMRRDTSVHGQSFRFRPYSAMISVWWIALYPGGDKPVSHYREPYGSQSCVLVSVSLITAPAALAYGCVELLNPDGTHPCPRFHVPRTLVPSYQISAATQPAKGEVPWGSGQKTSRGRMTRAQLEDPTIPKFDDVI